MAEQLLPVIQVLLCIKQVEQQPGVYRMLRGTFGIKELVTMIMASIPTAVW